MDPVTGVIETVEFTERSDKLFMVKLVDVQQAYYVLGATGTFTADGAPIQYADLKGWIEAHPGATATLHPLEDHFGAVLSMELITSQTTRPDKFCPACGHLWAWHNPQLGCGGVKGQQMMGSSGECGCAELPS